MTNVIPRTHSYLVLRVVMVKTGVHGGMMAQVAVVADDSMLIRHAVCRYLEQRGFAVETAGNGAEALELVRRLHPDLIITDLQMPRMSGSELISAIKANPRTASIPLVVLSSRSPGHETYPEARADHAILKDIDIVEQLGRVLDAIFSEQPESVHLDLEPRLRN